MKLFELIEKLSKNGGAWLATARSHLQRTPGGDHLIWGSQMPVNITVKQIEEMVTAVAATAIIENAAEIPAFDIYSDDPKQVLALMSLQSERYEKDADYRKAVDDVLHLCGFNSLQRTIHERELRKTV